MLSNVHLTRPLVFFDLETTGADITKDRIVELSTTKFFPDGSNLVKTKRFNPGIPISPEATAVHGITDEDVKNEPSFSKLAPSIAEFFSGCDLGGYNILRFDIPLLVEELLRANVKIPFNESTKYVDAMSIFHKMERRDLTAAYKFYCDKDLTNAHAAESDVLASAEVFNAQISRYSLENNVAALHDLCNDRSDIVDYAGKFRKNENGEIVFNFGKYQGKPVTVDTNYLQWMLTSDFPEHTKYCIRQFLSL